MRLKEEMRIALTRLIRDHVTECGAKVNAIFQKIRSSWGEQQFLSERTAAPDEIANVESALRLFFPTELRQYFLELNGMRDEESDDLWIEFFSLERCFLLTDLKYFRGIPDYGNIDQYLPAANRHLVVASYSLHCHVYTVEIGDRADQETAATYIVCGSEYRMITDSWIDFLKIYTEEPDRIFQIR